MSFGLISTLQITVGESWSFFCFFKAAAHLEVGSVLSTAALNCGVALELLGTSGVFIAHLGHLPVGEGGLQHRRHLDTAKEVVVEVQLEKSAAHRVGATRLNC